MAKSKFTSRSAKSSNDSSIARLFSDFDAQPAQITEDQLNRIEANFTGLGTRRLRRVALATLAMSGMQLNKAVAQQDVAVTFAEAKLRIDDYASRLRDFAGVIEDAGMRIGLALCSRPD